jgi:hypothetical protein
MGRGGGVLRAGRAREQHARHRRRRPDGGPVLRRRLHISTTWRCRANYTTGINCNSGDSTVFDTIYFEGNANYDIVFGDPTGAPLPIGCKALNSDDEQRGHRDDGLRHVPVPREVVHQSRRLHHHPRQQLLDQHGDPARHHRCRERHANVTGNRLNSAAATTARITDNSTSTITRDNYPEKPRVSLVGSRNRADGTASGDVSYTGSASARASWSSRRHHRHRGHPCDGYASFESGVADGLPRLHGGRSLPTTSTHDLHQDHRRRRRRLQSAILKSMDADRLHAHLDQERLAARAPRPFYVRARRS